MTKLQKVFFFVIPANEIVLKHKVSSYQDPDKIADGLSLIWDENHKWQKIAVKMVLDENNIKKTLKNIALRRNQIVHEADVDIQTGEKNSISDVDVSEIVNFIDKLGLCIYNCVK